MRDIYQENITGQVSSTDSISGNIGCTSPPFKIIFPFDSVAALPKGGKENALYIDKSINPNIAYRWDADESAYIMVGGAGGSGEGGGGVTSYSQLTDKPKINGVILEGDVSAEKLGIEAKIAIDSELSAESENPVQNKVVKSALDSLKIVETASGEIIVLNDASDESLCGLTLYGKTTQDGTPSSENPIPLVSAGDSGSLAVNLYGRNIYKISNATAELRGVTYSNINGALLMNGMVTAAGARVEQYFKNNAVNVPAGATVTVSTKLISGTAGSKVQVGIQQVHSSGTPTVLCGFNQVGDVFTYTVTEDMNISFFAQGSTVGDEINCMLSVMINIGDTASDYEAYKEPQTLAASTPNGLLGIPVTSGGNYTDENGQQWLCDEMDFERGVYVQRCGTISSYDGESIDTPYISSTGELSAGAEVIYALTEPVETSLTAAEIAAYKALHTNKPVTTIFNDSGAGMSVSYVADTKAYIDNKFAALEAAILSTGGNV